MTLEQKKDSLLAELQKADGSATVTLNGANLKVKYKGYDAIINITDGRITSFAKSSEREGSSLDATGNIRITDFSIAGTPVTNVPLPSSDFEKVSNTEIDNSYVARGKTGTDYEGDEFVWIPVDKDQEFTIKIEGSGNIASVVLTNPVWDTKILASNITAPIEITGITPTVENNVYNGEYKVTVTPEEGEAIEETLDVYSLYAFNVNLELDIVKIQLGDNYEPTIQNMGSPKPMISVLYSEPTDSDIDYAERVGANGGFWIGRYEASYNASTSKAASKSSTSTEYDGNTTNLATGMLWHSISRTDALNTAKSYNRTLKSSLPTGAAWDRALGWIYEERNSTGKDLVALTANSTSCGNYSDDTLTNGSNGLMNTGSTNETMTNNIYDLAGNLAEWSTEDANYGSPNPVSRGGCFAFSGSSFPVAHRGRSDDAQYPFNGFRLVLYK